MRHYLIFIIIFFVIFVVGSLGHAVEKNLVSEEITRKAADYFVLTNFSEYDLILYDSFSYYDLDGERIADIYVYAKNTKWLGQKQLLLDFIYRNNQILEESQIKMRDLYDKLNVLKNHAKADELQGRNESTSSIIRDRQDNTGQLLYLHEDHSRESDYLNTTMESIKAQLTGYHTQIDELLRIISGYDDFITVYISSSSNKMPLWEFREGLPEKYQLYRIEQLYARRDSSLPEDTVIYYNGPAQTFVKDARTNSIIHFDDERIEAPLEKLQGQDQVHEQ